VTVAQLLERHDIRRRYNTPTVTVLVGSVGTGGRVWRRWTQEQNRKVVTVTTLSQAEHPWLTALCNQLDLPQLALNSVALRLGLENNTFGSSWKHKTLAERQQFWQTTYPGPVTPLLQTLCELAGTDNPLPPQELASLLLEGYADPFSALSDLYSLLRPLCSVETWPTLLLQPEAGVDMAWLAAVAPTLAQWAFQMPSLALAVCVPPSLWQAYLTQAPESRYKALLREGVVECPPPSPQHFSQALAAAGWQDHPQPTAQLLADHGADEIVLNAAVRLIQATHTDAASDQARSAAEQFLYEFLQLLPETAGRWELNASLDLPFGSRPMEVDLLERSRRLVIEIDGYYHFRDQDHYRRDRTKDFLLQKHGYVVLRFLAEDVLCQLEQVRDRILEACRHFPPGVDGRWKRNGPNSGNT
jgi:hypothetical protein